MIVWLYGHNPHHHPASTNAMAKQISQQIDPFPRKGNLFKGLVTRLPL